MLFNIINFASNFSKNISKLAFLFVVFDVIASGSISHIVSCQMQALIEKSFVIKHIFGVLRIFLFIMFKRRIR